MDFALSEEQAMYRDLFREFAEKEVAPLAEHIDKAEEIPAGLFGKAAAQGFMGATLPEQYGGAGLDYLSYTLLVEEISKHCLSTAAALGIHLMLSAMTVFEGYFPVPTMRRESKDLSAMTSGSECISGLSPPAHRSAMREGGRPHQQSSRSRPRHPR